MSRWKGFAIILTTYFLIFFGDWLFFHQALIPYAGDVEAFNQMARSYAFESTVFMVAVTIVFVGAVVFLYGEKLSSWLEHGESSEADVIVKTFIEEAKRRDRENPAPDLDDYIRNLPNQVKLSTKKIMTFFRRHVYGEDVKATS